MDASVVLSILAIVVSSAAFYATTLRRGRLSILDGPSYAMSMSASQAILYLHLTFTNTGVRDWPIRNLRVVAPSISQRPLSLIATHSALPGSQVALDREYVKALVVPARGTVERVFEFQSGAPIFPWEKADFRVAVLIQPRKGGESYIPGARFPVRVDTTGEYGALLAHENADEPDLPAALTRKQRWWPRLARVR